MPVLDAARGNLDTLNMDFNKLNKEIAALRKAKQDAAELQETSKEMKVGAGGWLVVPGRGWVLGATMRHHNDAGVWKEGTLRN